jgi:Molecular chaperone, HSP90 family
MAEAGKNSRQFRAEVRKVLHILTNSLYTNREIFLRELVPTPRTRWINCAIV